MEDLLTPKLINRMGELEYMLLNAHAVIDQLRKENDELRAQAAVQKSE